MTKFVQLLILLMSLVQSGISNPGSGIQFLTDKNNDTIAAVIGTDTIALLYPWEVRRANDMKIAYDECREGSDSLSSIIFTLQEIKRKNESTIDRQEGDKRFLMEERTIDQGINAGLQRSLAAERKKSIPWKISTIALLVLGIIKYL